MKNFRDYGVLLWSLDAPPFVLLCAGHFIERVCHPAFPIHRRESRACTLGIGRVLLAFVRANSKYKYVICRSKGACVTEHLPRARGSRPYPKEHRLKRRVLLRQRKSMTYRQLPCCGDVGPSSSLLCVYVSRGLAITQGETPRRKLKIYRSWSRVRSSLCYRNCGSKLLSPVIHSCASHSKFFSFV